MPPKVIVKNPENCPRCQCPMKLLKTRSRNFECPYCAHAFCANCFEPVYEDDGHKVKCPHCLEVLFLNHLYMVQDVKKGENKC